MPFGLAREALEPYLASTDAVQRQGYLEGSARHGLAVLEVPGHEPPPRTGDPHAPVHGLYWVCVNIAESNPLVLILDDIHWADAESLAWLDYLGRRVPEHPILIVAAIRTGEPGVSPVLDRVRLHATQRISLGPLSPQAAARLVADQVGLEPSPDFVEACMGSTGGNPLLITELIRSLRQEGVQPDATAARLIEELGSANVARGVLVRLGRFGGEAIELARAVAVLGASTSLARAAELASITPARAAELADRLAEAEILTHGDPTRFVHPLVRSAIYADIGEHVRSDLHRRAARQLDEAGAGPEDVAIHLLVVPPSGDAWVCERLRIAAADATAHGAPGSARTYLERALTEPPPEDERTEFLLELGLAVRVLDPNVVPDPLIEIANGPHPRRLRLRATRELVFVHFTTLRFAEARRWSELALALASQGSERSRQLAAAQHLVVSSFCRDDPDNLELVEQLVTQTDAGSLPGALLRQALGWVRVQRGDPVDAVVPLLSSFSPGLPPGTNLAPMVAIVGLVAAGEAERARAVVSIVRDAGREFGLLSELALATVMVGRVELAAGRLQEAEAELRAGIDLVRDLSAGSFALALHATHLVLALVSRGKLDEATAIAAEAALEDAPHDELSAGAHPLEALGSLAAARGDHERAASMLLRVGALAEQSGTTNPAISPWRELLTPSLVRLGRRDEARKLIEEAERRARAFGAPHVIASILRARSQTEDGEVAQATLSESVERLEAYGNPYELARSLLDLGAHLRRGGLRRDAHEPLARALELAVRCGAGGVERTAREELAAIGSRPRRPMRSGVAALTPSELRVTRLAAEGLNNREIAERLFVTRRTVETHLTHAYGKLEITGRDELAEALKPA